MERGHVRGDYVRGDDVRGDDVRADYVRGIMSGVRGGRSVSHSRFVLHAADGLARTSWVRCDCGQRG